MKYETTTTATIHPQTKKNVRDEVAKKRTRLCERLRTIRQLADATSAISEATIRWWIFHAETNGLDKCIVRVGRRVYIDIEDFDVWLEGQRVAQAAKETK